MILKEENVSLMIKAIHIENIKKKIGDTEKWKSTDAQKKGTDLFTIYLKHIYARQRQGDLIG